MEDRKLSTCLWFDTPAEEVVKFYASIFPELTVLNTVRLGGDDAPALAVEFELFGSRIMALNGGPHFKLSEAVSLVVPCKDQAEIDRCWDLLLEGGSPQQCGWLTDKFGLSWQIVPGNLMELLGGPDPERRKRVMDKIMTMVKLDIATLQVA